MSSVYHGLFLVDKPQGMTSHDVVAKVRRILKTKEVGHCGTLDPLATGLLVLAVGEGTKVVSVLTEGDKGYSGQIQFGIQTDTLDITGEIVKTSACPQDFKKIQTHLNFFTGELELPVPRHSAIKVQGQRLYTKARNHEEFERPRRLMRFDQVETSNFNGETLDFSFRCSKGTFVRSWVEGLTESLGVCGTLKALRRTYSFPYELKDAITLEGLEAASEQGQISEESPYYIALSQVLPDWPQLRVYKYDLHLLRNGQISKSLKSSLIRAYQPGQFVGARVFAENSNQLLALIGLEMGRGFFIKRGFRSV